MGKAKVRKRKDSLIEQTRKHLDKFKEAKERGDIGSMEYMARELTDYLKQIDKHKKKLLPRKKRLKSS